MAQAPRPPSPQRVYVPPYTKADGTQVGGYWRTNTLQGPKAGQGKRVRDVGPTPPRRA